MKEPIILVTKGNKDKLAVALSENKDELLSALYAIIVSVSKTLGKEKHPDKNYLKSDIATTMLTMMYLCGFTSEEIKKLCETCFNGIETVDPGVLRSHGQFMQ